MFPCVIIMPFVEENQINIDVCVPVVIVLWTIYTWSWCDVIRYCICCWEMLSCPLLAASNISNIIQLCHCLALVRMCIICMCLWSNSFCDPSSFLIIWSYAYANVGIAIFRTVAPCYARCYDVFLLWSPTWSPVTFCLSVEF